jgi:hypothetical protein
MLILDAAAEDIDLVTDAAGDIEVHVSYMDHNAGTFTPAGGGLASITTATTTEIIGGPSAGQRNVKGINIRNNHASQAVLCTVRWEDTGAVVVVDLFECTLLAGEALVFTQGGVWLHYDVNGGTYPQVGAVATQAEMEAGTSLVTTVSPGRQHFHPSAAKFWAQVTGAGTPVLSSSYNVTSIADTAVGRMTVTIATDFSSANWCCIATTFTTTTTGDEGICNIDSKAAGTVEIGNRIITPAFGDPNVGYDVVGFGDL